MKSLFQSCPKASTFSVFVFPQTVHSNVLTPSSVQVGSVVIFPLSHLWPLASVFTVFLLSSLLQTVQYITSSYVPPTSHVASVAFSIFTLPLTCPLAGIVVISFLSSHLLQCIDFKPVSSHVASLSTVKSSAQS